MLNMTPKNYAKKLGLPPGTLIYTGKEKNHFEISILDYDENNFREIQETDVEASFSFKDSPTVSWINITGLHNTETIQKIGKYYSIHPLSLEDILNIHQRPKIEHFDTYNFIVLKMLTYNQESCEIESEQVSIVFGKNYVLTFQEKSGDVFDSLRSRIKAANGIIRKSGSEYLVYAIIDAIVDHYFLILEHLDENLEELESEVVSKPSLETVQKINQLKKNLITMRKSIWPLRELLAKLLRSEFVLESSVIYFRDVYDHTVQIIDIIESLRDISSGILDVYLSSVSNKTNEIMKTLTIIATIFIPLTFIVGIYGMNFAHMPELEWEFGYPFVLFLMAGMVITMIFYFKKKKWF